MYVPFKIYNQANNFVTLYHTNSLSCNNMSRAYDKAASLRVDYHWRIITSLLLYRVTRRDVRTAMATYSGRTGHLLRSHWPLTQVALVTYSGRTGHLLRSHWPLTQVALVTYSGRTGHLLRSHWSLWMGMERRNWMHGSRVWLRSSGSGKQPVLGS